MLLSVLSLLAALTSKMRQHGVGTQAMNVTADKNLPVASWQQQTPFQLASTFHSAECYAALSKENLTRWQKSNWPAPTGRGGRSAMMQWSFRTRLSVLTVNNTGAKVAYVRNHKAASTYLTESLAEILQATTDDRGKSLDVVMIFNSSRYITEAKNIGGTTATAEHGTLQSLIMTVVQDPIASAIKGYLEVSKQADELADLSGFRLHNISAPSYTRLGCNTTAMARRRLNRYLDGIVEGAPMGHAFYHSYPQAIRLHVVSGRGPYAGNRATMLRYQAIGRKEKLASDMSVIAERVGVRTISIPRPTESNAHTTSTLKCAQLNLSGDRATLRRLCSLYAVDYACLGYEKPALCHDDVDTVARGSMSGPLGDA